MEVFNIVLGILGFIGTVFGIYQTVNANKTARPFYRLYATFVKSSDNKTFNKFKLLYNDNILENASVIKFAFWNGGNTPLNYSDSPANFPFQLNLDDSARVLDVNIAYQTEPYNAVKVDNVEGNNIKLSFDYLEPGQGFIVTATYTAKSYELLEPQAVFKGVPTITQTEYFGDFLSTPLKTYQTVCLLLSLVILLFLFWGKTKWGSTIWITTILIGIFLLVALIISVLIQYFKHKRQLMPKPISDLFRTV